MAGENRLLGRAIPDPRPAGGPLPKGNPGRKPPMPKTNNHGRRPSAPPPHTSSGGKGDCCPMVAAVRAAAGGRWRLARRYAAWSVRLLAGRSA
jgi:hypothetical protein